MPLLRSVTVLEPQARRVTAAEVAGAPHWRSVCELPDGQPADMAVDCGRAAVAAAKVDVSQVDWLLHSGSGPQAAVGWPVHHHIRERVLGSHGDAFEVRQYCATGLTNWMLASHLVADGRSIICTGADNWSWGDRFVRTRSNGGRPFADVAHAAVIDDREGFGAFRGSGTTSQSGQADLWRTRSAFWEAPREADLARAYGRAYEARTPESDVGYVRMLAHAVTTALTASHLSPQYVTHFVPPMSGSGEPFRTLAKTMDLPWSDELHQHGLETGYPGVSTQAAGLVALAESKGLPQDSIVLLLAAEYQVSATAVVLDVVRAPLISVIDGIRMLA